MASPRLKSSTLLVAFIALTSVTAQTFQYSRGWTNGKRDGHKRSDADFREVLANMERTLTPCQWSKLKFVLEGKPFNERFLIPCDYTEEEDSQTKRTFKSDRNPEQILDPFI